MKYFICIQKLFFIFFILFIFGTNRLFSQKDTLLFVGDTAVLNVTGAHGIIQWQQSTDSTNWTNIAEATDSIIEVEIIASPSGKRFFRAKITNAAICENASWYSSIIRYIIIDNTADIKAGDWFHGGTVFYENGSGEGSIVNDMDLGYYQWGCWGTLIGDATDNNGRANTDSIVKFHDGLPDYYGNPTQCDAANDGTVAAKICDTLSLNGYTDWFMPAKNEIYKVYQKRNFIGNFSSNYYWSSTEYDGNYACIQYFSSGFQGWGSKNSTANNLRCIRKYTTSPLQTQKTFSTAFVVNEPEAIAIEQQPLSQTICHNQPGSFSVNASGTAPFSYQWEKDGIIIPGADSNVYTIDSVIVSDEGLYSCEITNLCHTVETNDAELKVLVLSTNIQDSIVFCNDTSVQLSANGSSSYPLESGTLFYQWSPSNGLNNSSIENPVAQPTSPLLYSVTVTDNIGCFITDSVYLNSKTPVTISVSPDSQLVCQGEDVVFKINVTGTKPINYQWYKEGQKIQDEMLDSLYLSTVSINDSALYYCQVSNYCRSVYSDSAKLDVVNIQVTVKDTSVCIGETFLLDAKATSNYPGLSGSFTYGWKNTDDLNDTTLLKPVATPEKTTFYRLVAMDDLGCIDSAQNEVFVQNSFANEQICIVTVDAESNKNLVAWEKTPGKGTKRFHIYRESVLADQYTHIGSIPFEDTSVYVDMFSEPRKQQYIYKITSEDTCGNESSLDSCESHKTMLLQYSGSTGGINLVWHRYEIDKEPLQFESYQIYRGTDSLNLSFYDQVSGNTFAYVDIDPAALSQKMYYRVYGILDFQCYPESKMKANNGPFSRSISNLEDNRQQSAGIPGQKYTQCPTVYPNPTKGPLTIKMRNLDKLEIRSISGKLLKIYQDNHIDINEFGPGIFIIKIYSTEHDIYREKVIVE
jgi:hypothetical protein